MDPEEALHWLGRSCSNQRRYPSGSTELKLVNGLSTSRTEEELTCCGDPGKERACWGKFESKGPFASGIRFTQSHTAISLSFGDGCKALLFKVFCSPLLDFGLLRG